MAEDKPSKDILKKTIVVIAILLVAVGGGLLARWLQLTVFGNDGSSQSAPLDDSELFPAAVRESRDLVEQGKFDEANAKLEDAIKTTSNDQDKVEYYLQLAINYQNQDQYQKAIDIYKQALAVKEASGIYQGMGGAAERLGDKQLAIDSYQKAIELLDTNSPMYQAEKERLEAYIKELQAS